MCMYMLSIYVCICKYVHVSVYTYVCVYVCMSFDECVIYTHTYMLCVRMCRFVSVQVSMCRFHFSGAKPLVY